MTEQTYTVSFTKGEIDAARALFDHAVRHSGMQVAQAAVHLDKRLVDAMNAPAHDKPPAPDESQAPL